jgi:hypothetical protein
MGARPIGATRLTLLLGPDACVAGSLLLGFLVRLGRRPPVGLLLLDLLIVASSPGTAFGAWHRIRWSRGVRPLARGGRHPTARTDAARRTGPGSSMSCFGLDRSRSYAGAHHRLANVEHGPTSCESGKTCG